VPFLGQIDGKTVGRTHFGGFEEEEELSDDEGVRSIPPRCSYLIYTNPVLARQKKV
jgi:hypothetical protein